MTRFRIEIDSRAAEDIDQALVWLGTQAPHKVEEWFDSFVFEIHSLETLPERCPLAPENGRWEPELELRQLLFNRFPSVYRILFTVIGDVVRILQIRHGSRQYLHSELKRQPNPDCDKFISIETECPLQRPKRQVLS